MDHVATTLEIYDTLTGLSTASPPALRLWNGDRYGPADAPSTLVLRHPGGMRALVLPATDLTAGEAYVYDDLDIEGDIVHALTFAAGLDGLSPVSRPALRVAAAAMRLPSDLNRRHAALRPSIRGRLHGLRRDRAAVTHHYDTGNDFFATFLGETMVYSCAYFLHQSDDLDAAQTRKIDVVARKLRLAPGVRLLDVGCGWGSMAIHAARHHGAVVTGITLSEEQAALATERAVRAGVGDRVTILVRDYRDMTGTFDAICSIGMVEHVGRERLDTYFHTLRRLLTPEGLLLNHGIVDRSGTSQHRRRRGFVGTYVFPDGDLLPLPTVIAGAEDAGFETRDVEALRVDYARTLRHWVRALEANREAAVAAAGERVYRIWRMYMAGSAVAFDLGAIGVYQVLLAHPSAPWRHGRSHLLAEDDARGGRRLVARREPVAAIKD